MSWLCTEAASCNTEEALLVVYYACSIKAIVMQFTRHAVYGTTLLDLLGIS